MGKHRPCNGHKNWNHWNVSMWINNEEPLYRAAKRWIAYKKGRQWAAEQFLAELQEFGITKTPDGAPYTVTTIRAAMIGM